MKTNILICIVVSLFYTAIATAGNQGFVKDGTKRSITLPAPVVSMKEGPGMDTTRRYCSICHSLDYITTQQKLPKVKWQAVVTKMVKVYGAPISEENVGIIADYIAGRYGTGAI